MNPDSQYYLKFKHIEVRHVNRDHGETHSCRVYSQYLICIYICYLSDQAIVSVSGDYLPWSLQTISRKNKPVCPQQITCVPVNLITYFAGNTGVTGQWSKPGEYG